MEHDQCRQTYFFHDAVPGALSGPAYLRDGSDPGGPSAGELMDIPIRGWDDAWVDLGGES
jgi:hypothetical protein